MSEIVARTPQQEVIAQIRSDKFRAELAAALPEGVSVERFARVTITALMDNPGLAAPSIDRASLFSAVIKCAQDGLVPDGKHAALVPYKGKVQYLPMIHGFRQIVAEYGWTLRTYTVHANDEFSWTEQPPEILHRRTPTGREPGELTYAYAVATRGDQREQLVMTREDVLKRMGVAQTDKVWNGWAEEMWEKTPGKALAADLPLDPAHKIRLARMLDASELENGESAALLYGHTEIRDGTPIPDDDDEPGLPPSTGEITDADLQALAVAAEAYVPPNGKFSAGGEHGPKTLGQIMALGDPGVSWFRWALPRITEPAEYSAAVTSYTRVFAPGLYQEMITKKELAG